MKKIVEKALSLLLLTLCIVLPIGTLLLGYTPTQKDDSDTATFHGLVEIAGENDLYYDPDTKIVYIAFGEWGGSYRGYGFMSPYYAENGLPYRYDVDSQTLVEISK